MDEHTDKFPEKTESDVAAVLGRAALGLFPIAGPLVSSLIETEYERKTEAFHRGVGKRISKLEINSTSSLAARATSNDQDAKDKILATYLLIHKLVQEAMDVEKRDFLAVAMASTLAWDVNGEELERRYFLRCLAEFEVIHIQLLKSAIKGPPAIRELHGAEGLPGEVAKTAWKELNDCGMVNLDSPNTMMVLSGTNSNRLTDRGARFLRFVGENEEGMPE